MQLNIQETFEIVRNGASAKLDATRVPQEMLAAIFAHGVAAKIGDAAASATTVAGESHFGKPKKDVNRADWAAWKDSPKGQAAIRELSASVMQGVIDTLMEGNWTQRGTGLSRAKLPDDKALAVKTAKQDLSILFKKITGLVKIADMVNHEKVAQFFDKENAWDDEKVIQWIDKQKAGGKRDYLAEAQAALAVDASDLDL